MSLFKFTNGTHYQDYIFEDGAEKIRWLSTIRLVLCLLNVILCGFVVSAIIIYKKTRARGFNLYLVFLLIPDIYLSLWISYMITSSFVSNKYPPTSHTCIVMSISAHFYLCCNMWVTVLTAFEVFQMLKKSANAQRFQPSPVRKVVCRVSVVYIASLLNGFFQSINLPFSDVYIDVHSCIGTRRHLQIPNLMNILSLLTIMIIPIASLLYVTIFVHTKGMVPPSGQSRFLATYFLRICFISIVNMTSICFLNIKYRRTLFIIANSLMLLQGLIVSTLSLQKPDIWKAASHIILYRSSRFENKLITKNTSSS